MEQKTKETILTLLALVVLTLAIVGISYAAFTYIGQGQRENTITTGNLTFVYDESNKSGNGISIANATPTTDEEGKASIKQGELFEFSVSASTKGASIYYEIYTTKQSDSTLPERIVKTYLTELQGTEEVEVLDTLNNQAINFYNKLGISQVPNQENGRTLYQEMIEAGQESYSKTFRYRMWIDENATETNERGVWKYSNKSFTVRVNVYASNNPIEEPLKPEQEPNEPVLVQGQIPVIYNEEQKSWVKADTGTNWYNYSNQEWANVVTVKEAGTKTREEYMSAEPGTEVSMEDINTMWVWIPRYEYMYTNLGTNYAGGTKEQPGEIRINFLNEKSATPSDSANYKVHPAFTFGSDELEGLWYAKFELSTTDNTCNLSQSILDCYTNCNRLMSSLQIKPNLSSWRFANTSVYFRSIRSMQLQYAPTYGFSTTDSDVHMSKNSEWESASYLSQSKYGKYGNSNYTGLEKQVRINNCNSYTTGVGANSQDEDSSATTSTTNSYETLNGQSASTTGNITGIYDMSGGASEYVMGVLMDSVGNPRSGWNTTYNSGFNGNLESGSKMDGVAFPATKYYDLYASSNPTGSGTDSDPGSDGALSTTACNGGICFGHGLSEVGRWYQDYYIYVNSTKPWFHRGGYYGHGVSAGVFFVSVAAGYGDIGVGARPILTPNSD